MAGLKGHSGRRSTANRAADGTYEPGGDGPGDSWTPDPDDPAPDGLETTEQVLAATQWLWRQQTTSRGMDPRTADAFNKTIAQAQARIRLEHGLNELGELRDLVRRQETAIAELRGHSERERYTAVEGATPTLGRVRVTEVGLSKCQDCGEFMGHGHNCKH